ncbi:MAG: hypothetical protein IJP91_00690 [Synergistaceae bacterium]|nr:hypothetical protein [Synergistaceae bacterium]
MSAEVFLKDHIRSLLSASKNDTSTKLLNLNSNVEDMFEQVDSVLTSLTNRVTALENLLSGARLFIDADGNLAQDDEEEEEENG